MTMRTPVAVLCVVVLLSCALASAVVKGTVVDGLGKPIPGADVWLAGDRYDDDGAPNTMGHVTTDADGRFLFGHDVKPGRTVTCTAWAEGRAIGWMWAAGPKAYARVVLQPPARVEGKVVDENGAPVPGAKVRLAFGAAPYWPGQLNWGWGPPKELADRLMLTTDKQGRFVVPWAGAGASLSFRASAPGYAASTGASSWTGWPIALKPAGTAVLEGQVTCPEDAAALKGLKARAMVAAGGWGWARTDEQGKFRITDLNAGLAQLTWETSMSSPWQPARVEDVALKAGQTKTITVPLVKAAELEVKVVEKGTGQPVPHAWVNVFGPVALEWGYTDDQGVAAFHAVPGQGDLTISADGPGPEWYDPRRTQAKLSAAEIGRTKGVAIELERAAFIDGRVVDEHGQPVAGAIVFSYQPRNSDGAGFPGVDSWSVNMGPATVTGEDGSFSLGGLASGQTYWLQASADDLMPVSETSLTASGRIEGVTLNVSSEAWCQLKGRIVDEKGASVVAAQVRLTATASGPTPRRQFYCPSVRPDADGSFVTPKMPAMLQYEVSASRLTGPNSAFGEVRGAAWQGEAGKVHDLGTLVLKEGGPVPMPVATPAPAPPPSDSAVAGRVVDADGNPVAGAKVFNRGDGPDKAEAISDADGKFRLTGRYAGAIWVFAEGRGHGFASKLARTGDENVEVTLPPATEPGKIGQPIAFNRPDAEAERKVAVQAMDEAWQWAKANHREASMAWQLVGPAALLRPELVAEMTPSGRDAAAWKAVTIAEALLATAPERAIAVAHQASGADWFLWKLALLGRRLVHSRPDLARRVLNEAVTRARAEAKPDNEVRALALAGAPLLRLDPGHGRAAVRQAAHIAGGLPRVSMAVAGSEGRDAAGPFAREEAAIAIAPIDVTAAMALVDGIDYWEQSAAKSGISAAIAAIDPARAEALLKETLVPGHSFSETDVYSICRNMAPKDPERAAKIARGMESAQIRLTALAVVGRALAKSDPERAAKLFDEVLAAMGEEPKPNEEATATLDWAMIDLRAATLAAAAGYSRTDEMVARSMALRADPYGPPPFWGPELSLGQGRLAIGWIAELLALFDRDGARTLLESRYLEGGKVPVGPAPRYVADPTGLPAAAAIDPAWALRLVQGMPDTKTAEGDWNPEAGAYDKLLAYFATPPEDRPRMARNRTWESMSEEMREDL